MAEQEQLTLNRDEAEMVAECLSDHLDRLTGSPSAVAEEHAKGFRLLVKLSKVAPHGWSPLRDLPDWMLAIIQRTFAPPPPAKPKKAAPKVLRAPAGAAGGAARKAPTGTAHPAPAAAAASATLGSGSSPEVQLTHNAPRRRGGLLRAAKAAETKGDKAGAAQYRQRADQLGTAAASHRVDP